VLEFYTAGSWLRGIHVASATASLALFALRGAWMLAESPRRHARWARIVPHVVDTVFLAAGIGLAARLAQYPFVDAWLTAKVFGLIAYVILGSIALKHGPTRVVRASAFAGALLVFAYVVGVARTRDAWSWIALLAS
jgi:uncharacterized membrane protein SirB2